MKVTDRASECFEGLAGTVGNGYGMDSISFMANNFMDCTQDEFIFYMAIFHEVLSQEVPNRDIVKNYSSVGGVFRIA